jgi:hypothetical protein
MTYYNINTKFHFGKYKGKTVKEVLNIQRSYLNWCAINLNDFIISKEDIAEMEEYSSRLFLTADAKSAISQKEDKASRNASERSSAYYHERPTYKEYRGSYAQDEMGFSDQTISDAFEGDADNYWNID